jgi:predicted MarR family transcription regulator
LFYLWLCNCNSGHAYKISLWCLCVASVVMNSICVYANTILHTFQDRDCDKSMFCYIPDCCYWHCLCKKFKLRIHWYFFHDRR